jgi:hypothetical protein
MSVDLKRLYWELIADGSQEKAIELVDLWIRRRAFQICMQASLLRRGMALPKAVIGGFNVLAAIVHRWSNSRFGAPDGWLGIYRKIL